MAGINPMSVQEVPTCFSRSTTEEKWSRSCRKSSAHKTQFEPESNYHCFRTIKSRVLSLSFIGSQANIFTFRSALDFQIIFIASSHGRSTNRKLYKFDGVYQDQPQARKHWPRTFSSTTDSKILFESCIISSWASADRGRANQELSFNKN